MEENIDSKEKNQDQEQQNEQDEKNKPKKKRLAGKVIVLFIALPILTIAAGMIAAFLLITNDDDEQNQSKTEKIAEIQTQQEKTMFLELPEFIVNLNSNQNEPNKYLKAIVALEYKGEETEKKIEQMMPRIIDSINIYTRELRKTDVEGAAGLQRLKEAIIRRINYNIEPQKIDNVLFKQILLQ